MGETVLEILFSTINFMAHAAQCINEIDLKLFVLVLSLPNFSIREFFLFFCCKKMSAISSL